MAHPKIRPATKADIDAFYGVQKNWSFRAVVADLNGEILGIGGIYYPVSHCGKVPVVFSEFRPEMRRFPMTLARGALEIMNIVKGKTCFAVASEKFDGSCALLERLGFEHIGERTYKWQTR